MTGTFADFLILLSALQRLKKQLAFYTSKLGSEAVNLLCMTERSFCLLSEGGSTSVIPFSNVAQYQGDYSCLLLSVDSGTEKQCFFLGETHTPKHFMNLGLASLKGSISI